MRSDGRKDIQSVKSAWSILHSDFKANVLPSLEGSNKRHKTNTHTDTHRHTHTHILKHASFGKLYKNETFPLFAAGFLIWFTKVKKNTNKTNVAIPLIYENCQSDYYQVPWITGKNWTATMRNELSPTMSKITCYFIGQESKLVEPKSISLGAFFTNGILANQT